MLRFFVALTLIAGAFVLAPKSALALPLALSDHATISKDLSSAVETVARRSVNAGRYGRYAYGPRRYNWTYYPYWRPYQYRYWQFYYPYGGPLF
ncbi:MAG TPA: hypothetical protein VHK26_14290 [Methyloceanibacter sp.]|jgi:hypothetical protein|nr:hypothetical protein [Methyloceanibacter sp.]